MHLANRAGYWYFPVSATWQPTVGRTGNKLAVRWLNQGVAPAYKPFVLRLHLTGSENSTVLTVDADNLRWMPGEARTEEYVYDIPDTCPPGKYRLCIELYDRHLDRRIEVGLGEKHLTPDGLIPLGEVQLE